MSSKPRLPRLASLMAASLLLIGGGTMLLQTVLAADTAELLKPAPRPQRPELPPSELPLALLDGERVALVGNSTAERMNLFGNFETLLHSRFPNKQISFRNFARPADEVGNRQRPTDYTKLDDPLAVFSADTLLCFFGFNESFAGPEAVEAFKDAYRRFLSEYATKYTRDDSGAAPRFVLVSPIAFESTANLLLPEGSSENTNLQLYSAAVEEIAAEQGLAFVDIFTPTLSLFEAEDGMQYTINGCHLNEAGDQAVAVMLDRALFGGENPAQIGSAEYEKLRAAVNDKSWIHLQDYRMVNGWYVYGGRRTWDTETFPREYIKLRKMAAVRDQYVWDIAQGKPVADEPDDSNTGELYVPPTRFGDQRQKYSEAEELRYLDPHSLIESCTVPPGFEIRLFADETQFPELANPVQMTFDDRGRLWVSTMPSYPMWKPGDPRPNDKLLILEDTDGDGRADECQVFYEGLHCPTGFEFFQGGVLVVDQPRLLWITDTDGDDKADQVVHFLDGFATDDTHHTIGAFESNHVGLLHMQEGVAMSTTVETPWGPFRNFGTPGSYVLDPGTQQIRHFVTPGYGNPWCYVFDQWGQGIVGDGTGAVQHWDTPLSGAQLRARRGLNAVFNNEGMRPAIGSEFLVSRNFPEDIQGEFTYACVINMNGMPRFEIHDDGAGFAGSRRKQYGQPLDLVRSSDKHFRPVDPQIGPDGALWFGDWANALIGHMQYSQRDPNRDHQRGRIYRLVYTGNPLVEPAIQHGKSISEMLDQLSEPEWRTRQRVRRALAALPAEDVLPEVIEWAAKIPSSTETLGTEPVDTTENDRLLCEALWAVQAHHSMEPLLLERVLSAPTFQARAAGTRVVADARESIPNAFDLLVRMSTDEHPRVRTEAIRGLSFYPTVAAAEALLATTELPLDYWTRYTLEHALAAHENVWRPEFLTGRLATGNETGQAILMELLASSKAGGEAAPYLRTLLGQETASAEQRNKALQALSDLKGDAGNGRLVFQRSCIACHKIGDQGRDYGPELTTIASKRSRYQLAESIIDPNAEVDAKYASTVVITEDGRTITGLLVEENDEQLSIFDGQELRTVAVAEIDERETLKQSSMPEGLGASLAPVEFLDVVEYLSSLK